MRLTSLGQLFWWWLSVSFVCQAMILKLNMVRISSGERLSYGNILITNTERETVKKKEDSTYFDVVIIENK